MPAFEARIERSRTLSDISAAIRTSTADLMICTSESALRQHETKLLLIVAKTKAGFELGTPFLAPFAWGTGELSPTPTPCSGTGQRKREHRIGRPEQLEIRFLCVTNESSVPQQNRASPMCHNTSGRTADAQKHTPEKTCVERVRKPHRPATNDVTLADTHISRMVRLSSDERRQPAPMSRR